MKWVKVVAVFLLLIGLTATANAKEIGVETIHNYIKQGESHWYRSQITSSTFDVYLIWNNPSNGLTLTIYSPDGTVKTYKDRYDGKLDGQIKVRITNAESGYWFFRVYGEKVSGVQFYAFAVYER